MLDKLWLRTKLDKLWVRTKEVATMYTGTFVVVMVLNQLIFFGFCLNPVCLIAAMPHVLFITVIIGTWLNKNNNWGGEEKALKRRRETADLTATLADKKTLERKAKNTELRVIHEPELNIDGKKSRNTGCSVSELAKVCGASVDRLLSQMQGAGLSHNSADATVSNEEKKKLLAYLKGLDGKKSREPKKIVLKRKTVSTLKTKDLDVIKNESKSDIQVERPVNRIFTLEGDSDRPPLWFDEIPPIEELPPWILDCNLQPVKKALEGYGVTSLWHMTHKHNIENILKYGILSNLQAHTKFHPVDISDHGAQRWRDASEPFYDKRLHEYVPTYLNIRNPMLYVKRDVQDDLCLIEISLYALLENKFIFTDGNAASYHTKLYNSVDDLEKLPWDVLNACYWNDFEDGKRKRCSEVLIYPSVEPAYIRMIHCSTLDTLEKLSDFEVRSKISKELFFH